MRGDGVCADECRADVARAREAAHVIAAAASPPLLLPPLLGFALGELVRLVRLRADVPAVLRRELPEELVRTDEKRRPSNVPAPSGG